MPAPTSSLATLRPDLGGSMEEFSLDMDRRGFIGLQVAPVFESAKASGQFGVIPIEELLQERETLRAPGASYNGGDWNFTPRSFATQEHGLKEAVDDNEATIYREWFDAELVSASRARDGVVRGFENRTATGIFNATTWTGAALTTALAIEWSTAATAKPITDVKAAKIKVWEGSGLWPNALVINRIVFENLRECAQIIDRMKSQGFQDVRASAMTAKALAQVFDVEQVIVAGSPKNTAAEGQPLSIAPLWSSEYAMVCRVAETNDLREPCIARTIHYGEDGSEIGAAMETYRDEDRRSDMVRARQQTDELIMYVEAGHLLSNVTAP